MTALTLRDALPLHRAVRERDLAAARHVLVAVCPVGILDDVDAFVAPQAFRPRVGSIGPDRLRRIARSWEQFDRAFVEAPELLPRAHAAADALIAAGVWLDAPDFADDVLFIWPDGGVAGLPGDAWRARLEASLPRVIPTALPNDLEGYPSLLHAVINALPIDAPPASAPPVTAPPAATP